MASHQSNSTIDTQKKSPQNQKKSPQNQKKSPQKLASKNANVPVEKLTSAVNNVKLSDSHHQSSKRSSTPLVATASDAQQKSQGIGSPSTSAKGLKKAGSVGSMSDAASDLKIPKDFKKEKRASVAEVPMREEATASAAAATSSADDGDDAAALEWFIDEEYLKEVDKESKPDEKQRRRELADNLKMEGNDIYKNNQYADAARVYTAALRTLPLMYGNERAILYSNRAACFLYMDEMDEGIHDCSKALEINPNYLKAILRRAQLYEKMEKLDEALTDYKKVLELEPKDPKALEACVRLPEEIRDRNDKLKTEMLGKLKDLGNMILKPFGLSTENFKVQQDPSSGSYSINLQQNK